MCRDGFGFRSGAACEDSSNLASERFDKLGVRTLPSDGSTAASPEPLLLVVQALLLGSLKGSSFHKEALAFVTLARAAEANDYGRQGRVLSAAATERSIASGQIDQVVEVSANRGIAVALSPALRVSEWVKTEGPGPRRARQLRRLSLSRGRGIQAYFAHASRTATTSAA